MDGAVQCVSPPAIANGKPSGQALAVFTSGMSVNYSCEPGYSVTGQASIYCTASGTWSSPPPRCEEVLCIAPEIQNGRKVAGRGPVYRPRDTVRFECDPGYTLSGSRQIQCRDEGTWDPPVPVCTQVLLCPPPPVIVKGKHNAKPLAAFPSGTYANYSCEPGYALRGEASIYYIPNGSHSGEFTKNFSFGSAVTYKCENGYLLTGEASIHCTTKDGLNGVWSARPPRCGEVRCPAPQIQNGRRVSGDRRVYLYNDSVTFECDPGYTMKGHSLSRCQTDDTWDPPLPVCEPEVLCIAPEVQNGRKVAGHGPVYRPRDTVRFECDPGYTLNGSRQIQCRDEGIWDPPVPACTQTTCVSPAVEHGRTNGVQRAYRPRDMVVFECDAGYTLSGSAETQCQDDGRWDPPVPTCERKVLCIAPEIQNGRKVAGREPVYRPRDTVRFECDPGYTLNGSRLIQCQDDGNWDSPVPACTQVLLCPPPPVIVKGKHNAKPLAAFPSGTYANYSCEPGYALRGEASIYCTTSGTWSHPSPLCEDGCDVPTRLSFAELKSEYKNQSSFPVGKTINYTCRPGYSRHPHMQSTITCLENRTWSEALKFCKKKSCGHPGELENGRVIVTDTHFGSTVYFTCEEGHRLIGQPYRRCEISGMHVAWSGGDPICEQVRCPAPQIQNGRRVSGDRHVYLYNDSVTFECDPGYTMKGHSLSQCQTDDTWDPPLPVCELATCVSPEVENGRTNGVQPAYRPSDMVVFECDPGYTMNGSPETQCQNDVLQCSFPPAITNGKLSVQALAVFTTGTSRFSALPQKSRMEEKYLDIDLSTDPGTRLGLNVILATP
ncbi:complement receptor type 2-like [Lepidochelys kempii]|uniref:complement receptor type 2-like n=1 Tax=Lepidochelys kempii TaxID=8472 RepID=UPI003C701AA1